MTYDTYFDITLNPDVGGDPDAVPAWEALSLAWRAVHGASRRTETPFAVAFPRWMREGFTLGGVMRIFVQGMDVADRLYDAIDEVPQWQAWAYGSRIRKVPKEPQAYESYRMRRLPSGVSRQRKTITLEEQLALRDRARSRILVQQQGLPFVRMRSSSGNLFRLVIERQYVSAPTDGVPNSYGLSRATQVVAVPIWEARPA